MARERHARANADAARSCKPLPAPCLPGGRGQRQAPVRRGYYRNSEALERVEGLRATYLAIGRWLSNIFGNPCRSVVVETEGVIGLRRTLPQNPPSPAQVPAGTQGLTEDHERVRHPTGGH